MGWDDHLGWLGWMDWFVRLDAGSSCPAARKRLLPACLSCLPFPPRARLSLCSAGCARASPRGCALLLPFPSLPWVGGRAGQAAHSAPRCLLPAFFLCCACWKRTGRTGTPHTTHVSSPRLLCWGLLPLPPSPLPSPSNSHIGFGLVGGVAFSILSLPVKLILPSGWNASVLPLLCHLISGR